MTRHEQKTPDVALARPVVAQANLDVSGRFVRAQLSARTAPGGRRSIYCTTDCSVAFSTSCSGPRAVGRTGEAAARRARSTSGATDEPTHRPPYFPRPDEEREIVRHKSVTPAHSGVDEAAADLEDMGYDFHLFTEVRSGQDSVLYRSGPTGYRLAQIRPRPDALAPHTLQLTVSDQPAPRLSAQEAAARMSVWDRPVLFFCDRESGRGALLYHRYDGHYGLVTQDEGV